MTSRISSWAGEIIEMYESGAASQFVLTGNVNDCQFLSGAKPRLGGIVDFLKESLLAKFDVILTYDLGNGIRVEKGGEIFAKWPSGKDRVPPLAPREAIHYLTHYLRFCANVTQIKPDQAVRVAVIVQHAELVVPPSGGAANHELNAMASQLRDWSHDAGITKAHCASFLLASNVNDIHSLLVNNPQAVHVEVPMPRQAEMLTALEYLAALYPVALKEWEGDYSEPAAALAGATLHSLETMLQQRQYKGQALTKNDLVAIKKELVEKDAQGLIEFVKPDRTLDDLHGLENVKAWLRQDIALWQQGELAAMPMGYLFCGPVGTGKTFLVECLAGEAGVPVVKMKNFRDKWVGSTEANLEKIFRLLEALGRCIVFVDEADQALGRRTSDSGDSGVNGRIYGMMAEQMSDSRHRGKILWALATSRPDLVEVDLKRPGRIDVKIPLFPTSTPQESYALLRALAIRKGVALDESLPDAMAELMPTLLTPGAAEALAVKLFRMTRTTHPIVENALKASLENYQAPVDPAVIAAQIELAVAEATDLSFVPDVFRK